MAKKGKPGKQDLYLLARELGYKSARQVVDVLRVNGIEGRFDPEKMGEYVAILTAHARTLASILNKLESGNTRKGGRGSDEQLPVRAEKVLRNYGQRPWLIRPVAIDKKGTYHMMQTRDIPEGWNLVYDGITKKEHLEAVSMEDAHETVGSSESSS